METFLTVIYVIVTLIMIVIILMQSGKGGMGAISGGSSTGSLFGGSGAGSFLNKATAFLAVLFVLLALILVRFSSHKTSSLAGRRASSSGTSASSLKNDSKKPAQVPLKDDSGISTEESKEGSK